MGQQYIETIGMYGKKINKEYSSEEQCYDSDNKLAQECRDMIFNKQYGIFFYEPSSKEEAEKMCRKFEEKIRSVRQKYDLPELRWDITFTDIKTDKQYKCDWVWCMFPNGKTGYRLEYYDDAEPYGQDFGTLIVVDGKLEIVLW